MSIRRSDRRADRRLGFTLVELSIVLAIVGVLAAVGGSQYSSYLDRARMARAIVELRGIASQIEPMGDDDTVLPDSLADAGLETNDPWGNPYQYLKIEGNLPPGMSAVEGEAPTLAGGATSLPSVGAPPAGAGAAAAGGAGGAGGGGGGGGQPAIANARKDRFLVPINSDFDLYSMGPDGESKPPLNAKSSRDDVIRAANGAFYGLAEKF